MAPAINRLVVFGLKVQVRLVEFRQLMLRAPPTA